MDALDADLAATGSLSLSSSPSSSSSSESDFASVASVLSLSGDFPTEGSGTLGPVGVWGADARRNEVATTTCLRCGCSVPPLEEGAMGAV